MKLQTFLKRFPDSEMIWKGTLKEEIKQKIGLRMLNLQLSQKKKIRCFFIGHNISVYYSELQAETKEFGGNYEMV